MISDMHITYSLNVKLKLIHYAVTLLSGEILP